MQPTKAGSVIAWSAIAVVTIANLAGYALNLYQAVWWFDRVLHMATISALTLWLGLYVCSPVFRGDRDPGLRAVLIIASIGVACGALWEVAEWALDQVVPGNIIKGKYDTIIDIVADTAGALVAGTTALWLMGPRTVRPQPG